MHRRTHPGRTITVTLLAALVVAACSGNETASTTDTSVLSAAGSADTARTAEGAGGAPAVEALRDGSVNAQAGTDAAAPEAAPPGDDSIDSVVFADHGVADWITTTDQPESTFQTDADVGSYRLARSWLDTGVLPPPEAVRAEEWINALDHQHPTPDGDDVWAVMADAGTPWWQPAAEAPAETRLMRVGLRAAEPDQRPAASITFVIDTSGSMKDNNRLGTVVETVSGFLDRLGPDDRVAVVAFSDGARRVIDHTADHEAVRAALATLRPEGSTNTADGVALGHQMATDAHREGTNSSVVVLADGMANVGEVAPNAMVNAIADAPNGPDRVVVHTVGIGRTMYNDALLERLANAAGGTYAYIDRPDQAARLFDRDLPLLHPIAHDVKAQVTFDAAAVRSWRLIGYENRTITADQFRDDTVPGGYVGAGHEVTAIYEVALADGESGSTGGDLGTVTVRWADPGTGEVQETAVPLDASLATTDSQSPTWADAAGMAAVVESLRGSPHVLVNVGQVADRAGGQVAEVARAALAASSGTVDNSR